MAREVLKAKSEKSRELLSLMQRYKTVALVDAYRLKTSLLNQARELFRDEVLFKYVKNSALFFSADMSGDQKFKRFVEDNVRGTTLLALSNKDPYDIQQSFIKSYVELPAKAGDIIYSDVVVKAGNTGLPPGPVISELNAVGIPTKIESGSVWITRDTVVARSGDKISPRLASALSKLGIKPVKTYLRIKAAFTDGVTIPGDMLQTPLEEVKSQILEALEASMSLGLASKYTTPETAAPLLLAANSAALGLALAINFPTPDALHFMIARAQSSAAALESSVKT